MNLQSISPQDHHGQRVSCFGCGARVDLSTCLADLDGPAFKAYYCGPCVAELDLRKAIAILVDAGFNPFRSAE